MSVVHDPPPRNASVTRPLRVAMIGCGTIAEVYHLPALAAHRARLEELILVDPSTDRAESLAAEFGGTATRASYEDVLDHVDAAIVATPHSSHFSISSALLEHGIHVLCEKPLVESVDEAKQLVELAAENRVSLCVNQTRRLFPAYGEIRDIIQSGRLGAIRKIEFSDCNRFSWPSASGFYFRKASPKGVLLDKGIHVLDTICWWLGEKPRVEASFNDAIDGIETVAKARFGWGSAEICVHVSWLAKSHSGFRVEGELGTIEGDIESWGEVLIQHRSGNSERIKCSTQEESYNDFGATMVDNLLRVAAGEASPLVPAHDVLAGLELMEACYDAATPFAMPWFETGTIAVPTPAHEPARDDSGDEPDPESRTMLVTGAGGFLGARICEMVHGSGFACIRGGVRKTASGVRLARAGVESMACDIMSPGQLREAMDGVTDVVHCAYVDDRDVIVEGTRNVLQVALEANVRRLVFLSTAEVYGPDVHGAIDEETRRRHSGSLYADAKIDAEQLCWEFGERGLPVTVLRPSIVYGPFSDSKTTRLAKRLRSGNWGQFAGWGDGNCNLIYVDDLVRAICLCVAHDGSVGQAFHVNGPDRVTWNEYFARFNDALGLPPLPEVSTGKSKFRAGTTDSMRKFSGFFLRRFGDQIMAYYLRGGRIPRMMKRFKDFLNSHPSGAELTKLYSRKAVYEDDKIRQRLKFEPAVDLNHGLTLCSQWLNHHEI